jgi:hypothetical protein
MRIHGTPVEAGRTRRKLIWRGLLVACLAALALSIPTGTASGGSISVQASLGGCEPAGDAYRCQINASFTGVSDAEYYTASVTGPDGGTQDFGTVPAGSASVWPTYTGDGTYTITITAWDGGKRVNRDTASAGG